MRERSFGSVKITYFDKERVLQALDDWTKDLVQERPEIERVVLFGSVASGIPVPGSDVDLMIIVSSSSRRFLDRISEYLPPPGFPVGADVFPYTEAEFDKMVAEGNPFIKGILKEGIELYRREH